MTTGRIYSLKDTVPGPYSSARFWELSDELRALGYSRLWQARQFHQDGGTHEFPRWAPTVTAANLARMQALVVRVANVPATPENTGMPRRAISRVLGDARRSGHLPLLEDQARPVRVNAPRLAQRESANRRCLAVFRAVILEGTPVARATRRHDYDPFRRFRALGLKFTYDPVTDRSVPRPASAGRVAVAAKVLAEMPIDFVAVMRGTWTVDDIDPDWSASDSWISLKDHCLGVVADQGALRLSA